MGLLYQIFFKNSSGNAQHTGLVYKVDNKYVYTIEGNTSSAKGVVANGGCVRLKQYALNYNRIMGYGRPNYEVEVVVCRPAKYHPSCRKEKPAAEDFIVIL